MSDTPDLHALKATADAAADLAEHAHRFVDSIEADIVRHSERVAAAKAELADAKACAKAADKAADTALDAVTAATPAASDRVVAVSPATASGSGA